MTHIVSNHIKNIGKKRKILFLSQYFPPDITAASFRISETANLLFLDGFSVNVLTARPHREHPISTENYKIFPLVKVIRAPIIQMEPLKKGKLGYIIHYLSFMISSLIWGLFKTSLTYDYIIVSSPPLFIGISGWVLSRVKRAKYILDIRDIWPDSAVSAGQISENGFLYEFGKKLERFLYKKANLITSVSKKIKHYISSLEKNTVDIEVIYNGLDENLIKIDSLNSIENVFEKNIPDNKFNITYLGNMGLAQDLNTVIDAAIILNEKGINDINFLLIGGGVKRAYLEERVRRNKLKNIVFMGPFDKKTAFKFMLGSSVLLIHLKDSEVFKKTIPSKVFDYSFANKPILFGIEGEGNEILSSLPGNIYFKPGNPISLVDSILKLYKNYDYYLNGAIINRNYVLSNYSRGKMTKKLESLLKELK
ncbi:glycosyltransferase family 4 protein [candidate division WOR-3 bacterium]|nr:glycosyltransferase family 4 protein [candidate division WOR-3 bacterium]